MKKQITIWPLLCFPSFPQPQQELTRQRATPPWGSTQGRRSEMRSRVAATVVPTDKQPNIAHCIHTWHECPSVYWDLPDGTTETMVLILSTRWNHFIVSNLLCGYIMLLFAYIAAVTFSIFLTSIFYFISVCGCYAHILYMSCHTSELVQHHNILLMWCAIKKTSLQEDVLIPNYDPA